MQRKISALAVLASGVLIVWRGSIFDHPVAG